MNLVNRLENIPVGKFHYQLLLITGLGWMFDAIYALLMAIALYLLSQA